MVVPKVLGDDEVAGILARAKAIAHGEHPPAAKSSVMRDIHFAKKLLPMPEDPERALWKIMNADRFDPALREAMRSPGLLDAVSGLLGDDLLAFLFMLIYKPPGVPDSVHPFHQDGLYFQFGPHDLVAGAWVPLDPVDDDNGTLCVVPGTHKLPITGHEVIPGRERGRVRREGRRGLGRHAGEGGELRARARRLRAVPSAPVPPHRRQPHRPTPARVDDPLRERALPLAHADPARRVRVHPGARHAPSRAGCSPRPSPGSASETTTSGSERQELGSSRFPAAIVSRARLRM